MYFHQYAIASKNVPIINLCVTENTHDGLQKMA